MYSIYNIYIYVQNIPTYIRDYMGSEMLWICIYIRIISHLLSGMHMQVVIWFRGHVPPEGDLKRLVSFDLQTRWLVIMMLIIEIVDWSTRTMTGFRVDYNDLVGGLNPSEKY